MKVHWRRCETSIDNIQLLNSRFLIPLSSILHVLKRLTQLNYRAILNLRKLQETHTYYLVGGADLVFIVQLTCSGKTECVCSPKHMQAKLVLVHLTKNTVS